MPDFDLVVLGGGTGGLPSAVEAADMGKDVALIERDKLAGTCLNYGCTPTKAIIYPAKLLSSFRGSKKFGVEHENLKLNFSRVMGRARSIVSRARRKNERKAEERENITLFRGTERFIDQDELQVGGQSISGEQIFIATGASPFVPPIEGLEEVNYYDHKSILGLEELPESIVIVGGGFISVEYASAFNALGSRVTVIQRGKRLIKKSDAEIAGALAEYLTEDGVDLRLEAEPERVEKGSGIEVTTKDGQTVEGEVLLMAVGLRPNTKELNLEACKVETDKRGYIEVDGYGRTSNPKIWAFGDVVGGKMFTHAALKEFATVVKNAFSGVKIKIDESALPYAIFTEPEVGSVGLTEEEARERGLMFHTRRAYYGDTSWGIITEDKRGFVKLLHNRREILGCHAVGAHASILVQEIAALMNCSSSLEAFHSAIHTHPTIAEIFEDLK